VAAQRAAHRERTEEGRERDAYESDADLQERTAVAYAQLAAASWLSEWTVLDGSATIDADALAAQLLG
jgi:dTMP kinase